MHSTNNTTTDPGIRDLSHLTEEEQVEYLIKMTEEEAKIDFRAGVEFKSPGKIFSRRGFSFLLFYQYITITLVLTVLTLLGKRLVHQSRKGGTKSS